MFCNLVLKKNFAELSVRSMDIVNAKSTAPFIFSCLFSVLRFFGECNKNTILKKSRVLGFAENKLQVKHLKNTVK